MRDGETPTLCCFDLEKAFDPIEYSVLLGHLFKLGIRGKCWRLLSNWYYNSTNVVKLENSLSPSFPVCRGVKQGSVLSPTLFITIMDVLLECLEATHLGLSLYGLDVGCAAHADDIRALNVWAFGGSTIYLPADLLKRIYVKLVVPSLLLAL